MNKIGTRPGNWKEVMERGGKLKREEKGSNEGEKQDVETGNWGKRKNGREEATREGVRKIKKAWKLEKK